MAGTTAGWLEGWQKPESSRRRDVDTEDRSHVSMDRAGEPILRPDHKIFLSHSGAQKKFVRKLCRDLEKCYHFAFFDERDSSLPKGERFPELILRAAGQCRMAVVVVSEEYFVSKWPMIELHAFEQARLRSNPDLKILPVFYKLTVTEFCDESRRNKWFSVWEDLAKDDPRINIDEWKESLKVLASFNGIQYNPDSKGGEAYREEIVLSICKKVQPDIKWDDSHVQGRSLVYQELDHMIDQIRASSKERVTVGIYGVGGIGKTTLCNILCNELFQELKGKVSHVEFGSGTCKDRYRKVLKDLTSMSQDVIQQLNEGQCKHILLNNVYKHKVFLAIDNVWRDSISIEEAKVYLQAPFHEESIVLVAGRSIETLTDLGLNQAHCFEMPRLKHEEAMNLFLYHAAHGTTIVDYNIDDKHCIERCIGRCYFHKGEKAIECSFRPLFSQGGHYLPLALKALGVQLGCIGRCPSQWIEAFPIVKDFDYFQEGENPVFSVLRSSFDRLLPMHQKLFMDLIVYHPFIDSYDANRGVDLLEWLSMVHKKKIHEIESQLQHLKGRGLVEHVDIASKVVYVHDLYREFAILEAKGSFNYSSEFEKRSWVYYDDAYPTELEMTPSNGCWQNLKRICISRHAQLEGMEDIKWRCFMNVEVLKLDQLFKWRGVLSLHGLKHLRSLDLSAVDGLDSLDGLQNLKHLTYFRWLPWKLTIGMPAITRIGQLPMSLKVLRLGIGVLLRNDVFARCTNLRDVDLLGFTAEKLDFSSCKALERVRVGKCRKLEMVSGLQDLQKLTVFIWSQLLTSDEVCLGPLPRSLEVLELDVDVQLGLDVFACCTNLREVFLSRYRAKKLDFSSCKALQRIRLGYHRGLEMVLGLQDLQKLTVFTWSQLVTFDEVRLGPLPGSLEVLKLDVDVKLGLDVFAHCTNLREVDLSRWRAKKLDFGSCEALQRVMLGNYRGLSNVIGLQDLENLTFFKWSQTWSFDHVSLGHLGHLPRSLVVLELDVDVQLGLDVFARCTNLREVDFLRCRAEKLDFSSCKALHSVKLGHIGGLEMVSGLQDLQKLTCFKWSQPRTSDQVCLGPLPRSLEVLKLDVDVLLGPYVFIHCTNLREVDLMRCRAKKLDLSSCKALLRVRLGVVVGLETVLGLENRHLLYVPATKEVQGFPSF